MKRYCPLIFYVLLGKIYKRHPQLSAHVKKSKNLTSAQSASSDHYSILYYSKRIVLHFKLLQLVRLTERWSTYYKTRIDHLIKQRLLSGAINWKEKETLKVQCGSMQWNLKYI